MLGLLDLIDELDKTILQRKLTLELVTSFLEHFAPEIELKNDVNAINTEEISTRMGAFPENVASIRINNSRSIGSRV